MEESKEKDLDVGSELMSKNPSDSRSSGDAEKQLQEGEVKTVHLKRKLQSRHLQMIAIGGTIGTGLVSTLLSKRPACSRL